MWKGELKTGLQEFTVLTRGFFYTRTQGKNELYGRDRRSMMDMAWHGTDQQDRLDMVTSSSEEVIDWVYMVRAGYTGPLDRTGENRSKKNTLDYGQGSPQHHV